MRMTKSTVAVAAVGLTAAGMLAACSSSSSTDTTASASLSTSSLPTSLPSASLAPSPSLVGGDPSTWAPINVTQADNGTKIKLVVGQNAIFTDLPQNDATTTVIVRAKPKGIVRVTQQTNDNGTATNAGFQAIATGKTTVTVYDGKPKNKKTKVIMTFTVRVKVAPPASPAASAVGSVGASASAG
jgi:predicted secreted protein